MYMLSAREYNCLLHPRSWQSLIILFSFHYTWALWNRTLAIQNCRISWIMCQEKSNALIRFSWQLQNFIYPRYVLVTYSGMLPSVCSGPYTSSSLSLVNGTRIGAKPCIACTPHNHMDARALCAFQRSVLPFVDIRSGFTSSPCHNDLQGIILWQWNAKKSTCSQLSTVQSIPCYILYNIS